jgi:hypothetical protein
MRLINSRSLSSLFKINWEILIAFHITSATLNLDFHKLTRRYSSQNGLHIQFHNVLQNFQSGSVEMLLSEVLVLIHCYLIIWSKFRLVIFLHFSQVFVNKYQIPNKITTSFKRRRNYSVLLVFEWIAKIYVWATWLLWRSILFNMLNVK